LGIGKEGATSDRDVKDMFWHGVKWVIKENNKLSYLKSTYDENKNHKTAHKQSEQ
jgi:hypothetical protein